ncbi:ABC transporter permease [Butyricicoccus sp. Marseille-Q5471]|uniref:ABC transporter permease n=1 Tax=Butyricicoccus sp. Marseille-Q5471 TaxID=3039493 RepID=UPI0024BCFCC2|nr:ABC transporter permease [Butyricicoccus sp. Marseille-Q5471]
MKKKNGGKYAAISVLSVALFIFVWWLVSSGLGLTTESTLPGPDVVLKTFIKKLSDPAPDGGTMFQHIGSSLRVAMSGYLMGVVIGTPLGILMAWYKKVDLFARPLFDLLRPVPGIAWIPLMIIMFGIGMTSKVVTVFLAAFVPCVLNSYTGIRQTKDVHLWVGQTFGASNWQMLTRIAVPTSLPLVMTGVRVALGASWTTIVAAELLASTKGLGFMIQQARGIYRPDVIIAGMIAIGAIGALLTWVLTIIEHKVVKGVKA